MKYCARCLYPENHPLYLTFDARGLCSGCLVHEEKDRLDWNDRQQKLAGIVQQYRSTSGRNYDCIVPVSGARDSWFTVHTVKNVLGMNPLLVTYNKQYNTDVGIRNLANLRMTFGCDLIALTVDPDTVKRLTRATMRRRGSIYWHCLAGQTVFPVQTAARLKIPLIVWGVHQGVDQVGMFSHSDEVEMTRKYRKEHDLMGLEAEDLVNDYDAVHEDDVLQFRYPDDGILARVGVRGIYLSNYIRWDTKSQHEAMIKLFGYETARQTRTFDIYSDVDCFNYSDVHDYIKAVKHGFGKATDHASREIRFGRMSREEGVDRVRAYARRAPRNLHLLLDWIGMTESGFHYIVDQHRNPALWRRNDHWQWELAESVADETSASAVDAVRLPRMGACVFEMTASRRPGHVDDEYVLFGKGYQTPGSP